MNKVNYKPLVLEELTPEDIGIPVYVVQKWDKDYGILTGYNKDHIFVHLGRAKTSFMITDKNVFKTFITKE